MRPLVLLLSAALLAGPAFAQAPVSPDQAHLLSTRGCRDIVEADGAQATIARAGKTAGWVAREEHAQLRKFFFKEPGPVTWWRRPSSAGQVLVAYDPQRLSCRVFLLGVAEPKANQAVRDDLTRGGWIPQSDSKSFVKHRDNGDLTAISVIDMAAGTVHPETLTALTNAFVVPADEDE
jgi:hypothetical protein